jgi:hypothetical protein
VGQGSAGGAGSPPCRNATQLLSLLKKWFVRVL